MSLTIVSSLLQVARAGLSLAEKREENYPKRKIAEYVERLREIEDAFYEEYNRDPETRSDAALDYWMRKLCDCSGDLASFLGAPNVPDKQ